MENFYRYLDVDGDGIPYRSHCRAFIPKGAYFTRGSGHTKHGAYTRRIRRPTRRCMDRLLVKWETARSYSSLPPTFEYSKFNSAGILTVGSGDGACP